MGEKLHMHVLENSSKSHMISSVFQYVFNCISTYAHAFPEYLLHNFNNLSIKFYENYRKRKTVHVELINILK